MTRTLGDRDMRKYGCISTPDITHLKLEETDLAVIVASDGFWDEQELTMQQVLDSVPRRIRHKPIELCHSLMNLVSILGGPTDDCTIVCLTLR